MPKKEKRGDPPYAGIASLLYFHSKSPVFTQNRTAGQLKLLPMKWPPPYSPSFPLFLFLFLLLLLFLPCHPFFFLPLPFPLSFLFLSLCPYLFFLPLFTTTAPTFHPPVRHTLLLLWLFYLFSTRARTLFKYKRL